METQGPPAPHVSRRYLQFTRHQSSRSANDVDLCPAESTRGDKFQQCNFSHKKKPRTIAHLFSQNPLFRTSLCLKQFINLLERHVGGFWDEIRCPNMCEDTRRSKYQERKSELNERQRLEVEIRKM